MSYRTDRGVERAHCGRNLSKTVAMGRITAFREESQLIESHGDDAHMISEIGRSMMNIALLEVLKRMKRTDLTVHGFRSSFRDGCVEPSLSCLAAGDSERAENQSRAPVNLVLPLRTPIDLLDKRRNLMRDWSKYIDTKPNANATITGIRRRG